jgi:acyl-coenzyme A thioesterase PaaI-like protein
VTESSAETTEEMLARVRASFDRQAMMSTLGVEVTAVEPGKVEMSLRHDDRFTQQHGSCTPARWPRCWTARAGTRRSA